jgi:hypothetical protein
MPRRGKYSQEPEPVDPIAAIVSRGGSSEEGQAEEHRQIRAALAEYFLILQEWSQQERVRGPESNSPEH